MYYSQACFFKLIINLNWSLYELRCPNIYDSIQAHTFFFFIRSFDV